MGVVTPYTHRPLGPLPLIDRNPDPKWDWFFEELVSAAEFSTGDLVERSPEMQGYWARTGGVNAGVGRGVRGYHPPDAGGNVWVLDADGSPHSLSGDVTYTRYFALTRLGNPNHNAWLGIWELFGNTTLAWQNGGAVKSEAFGSSVDWVPSADWINGFHGLTVQHNAVTSQGRMLHNGEITVDQAAASPTGASGDLRIWNLDTSNAFGSHNLVLHAVYQWLDFKTPGQLTMLDRDPWGPFRPPSAPDGFVSAAGPQTITASPVTVDVTIPSPSVSGSGSAGITASPVAINVTIPSPGASGSGSAPVTASPVAWDVTIPSPAVSGSGSAPITASPVPVDVTIPSPSVSGSGAASITVSPVSVVITIPTPTPALGAGVQTVVASPVALQVTIPTPTPGATGSAPITASPVQVDVTIPSPSVSGTGTATITATPVGLVITIPTPSLSAGLWQEITATLDATGTITVTIDASALVALGIDVTSIVEADIGST